MAGFYPDVPGQRIPYDVDGTLIYKVDESNIITQLTGASVTGMNDESDTGWAGGSGKWLGFIFPEPRTISGLYVSNVSGWGTPNCGQIAVSTDTTNIIDGTWTEVIADFTSQATSLTRPFYRTNIVPITNMNNVKAVRFFWAQYGASTNVTWRSIHFYGSWSNPGDYLQGWHPTLNQALQGADLDFGDTPQGTTDTKQFRVKNVSATLTANDTVISDEALTDASPSIPPQYQYSLDGITFTQTVTIPSIAPATISPVVYVRRITPTNAALSVYTVRIKAVPGTWA